MLVGRFSDTGFDPCFQSYMYNHTQYLLNWDEEKERKLYSNSYSRGVLETIKEGVIASLRDLDHSFNYTGIHVFFLPLMESTTAFQLNHLRDKDRPPYHEKWFDDETPAYALGRPCSKPKSTLGELHKQGREGAYIPL